MEQRDFSREDSLFALVQQSHDAVRDLFLECHELGSGGMGRQPR
jgi:hypothetical protein